MAAPALDFWFDFASTYSYPAAMRFAPARGRGRRRGQVSAVPARADLQGARLGPPRRSTSFRPRAATCGATSNGLCAGLVLAVRCAGPNRFRRTACSPHASRWPDWPRYGARSSAARVFRAEFADGRRIDDGRKPSAPSSPSSTSSRRRCSRPRCPTTIKDAAAGRDRRGAAAWPVRRAELLDRRRRAVLGQRPARTRARLGEART